MSTNNLNELKRQHDEYNARLKAKGVAMLTYTVPCCGGAIEGRAGPAKGQWDTLATCPHCGGMYMKISTATAITALVPESAATTERTA